MACTRSVSHAHNFISLTFPNSICLPAEPEWLPVRGAQRQGSGHQRAEEGADADRAAQGHRQDTRSEGEGQGEQEQVSERATEGVSEGASE